MSVVFLGLGSNLGQKEKFLLLAISEIEKQMGHVEARSAFFESAPWGFDSPNSFVNACIAVKTNLSPQACLRIIAAIESRLGRIKTISDGYKDRVIDIDILFYDQLILQEKDLTIPHPLLHQRLFVLHPLAEIAPEFVHPLLDKTIKSLLEEINGQS